MAAPAANVSANSVLYMTAAIGLAFVIGRTVACAGIYDAVVERDRIFRPDQPALDESIDIADTNTQVLTWFTHLGGPIAVTIMASAVTIAMVWRWRLRTPLSPSPRPWCGAPS